MKKYIGMNFATWCSLDTEDSRKINYTVECIRDRKEQVIKFTSDDCIDPVLFNRVAMGGIIKELNLKNNKWYITIVC